MIALGPLRVRSARGVVAGTPTRAVLLACVCLLAAGCGGDAPPPPAADLTKMGPPEASRGKAVVNVDNGSTDEWELYVDGRRWCTVKPHTPAGFELSAGKHVFTVTGRQEQVDKITAVLESGTTTVINPNALSTYVLWTETYTSGNLATTGSPPRSETVCGQRVAQAHYGLLQEAPESVPMHGSRLDFSITTTSRTKLRKALSANPSVPEALAFLHGHECVYQRNTADCERAIAVLGAAPKEDAIRDLLLSLIESETYVKAAYRALQRYEAQITDERLAAWLKADCRDYTVDHQAARERLAGALAILLSRGRDELIAKLYGSLPEVNRADILGNMFKAPVALRRAIILQALKTKLPSRDDTVRLLIKADEFTLDADFARQIDAHVQALRDEQERSNWASVWGKKLCEGGNALPDDYILPRLAELLRQAPDQWHQHVLAVAILLQHGKCELVTPLLKDLQDPARRQAVITLEEIHRKTGQLPAGAPALLVNRLTDADADVRMRAFLLLCSAASKDKEVLNALLGACQRETNLSLKEQMDRTLAPLMTDEMKAAHQGDSLKLACSAPTQQAVNHALRNLLHDSAARQPYLAAIAAEFLKIPAAANRAWLLLGLRGWFTAPDEAAWFNALCDRGLDDADRSVRVAAARGRMDTPVPLGPEAEKVKAAIQGEADADQKKTLERDYADWFIRCIAKLDGKRPESIRTLLDLAAGADERIALAALDYLPYSPDDQARFAEPLGKLYGQTESWQIKWRILGKLPAKDERTVPLCKQALSDASAHVRLCAFRRLESIMRDYKKKELLAFLQNAAEKEQDAATKKEMDSALKGWLR